MYLHIVCFRRAFRVTRCEITSTNRDYNTIEPGHRGGGNGITCIYALNCKHMKLTFTRCELRNSSTYLRRIYAYIHSSVAQFKVICLRRSRAETCIISNVIRMRVRRGMEAGPHVAHIRFGSNLIWLSVTCSLSGKCCSSQLNITRQNEVLCNEILCTLLHLFSLILYHCLFSSNFAI